LKTLILYESLYGNTEEIARAIAGALGGEVRMLRVNAADPSGLTGLDLLIVGAPTQGGRAMKSMQVFLDKIPAGALKGTRAAAFDTRLTAKWVKIFGYAAGKIADSLKGKGAGVLATEGFWVKGTKGPLQDGESERAAAWAKGLLESQK